jgi:hypothetical protein
MGSTARSFVLISALALVAGGAGAETFTVTLDNGASLVSRYRPRLAPSGETVYFLTDVGNWIAFDRANVVAVTSELESKGYGLVIDTTTISLGIAPNDRDVLEGEGEVSDTMALLNYLRERDAAIESYTVPQFVEPEQAAGIPLSYTQNVTPPMGYIPPN